jgi:UDP-N-acetylmuramoylalanine-D-glutamate ligase
MMRQEDLGMAEASGSKIALVTGGGTGIGRAIAEALLKNGYTVVLSGRRFDVLQHAAKDMAALTGGTARAFAAESLQIVIAWLRFLIFVPSNAQTRPALMRWQIEMAVTSGNRAYLRHPTLRQAKRRFPSHLVPTGGGTWYWPRHRRGVARL